MPNIIYICAKHQGLSRRRISIISRDSKFTNDSKSFPDADNIVGTCIILVLYLKTKVGIASMLVKPLKIPRNTYVKYTNRFIQCISINYVYLFISIYSITIKSCINQFTYQSSIFIEIKLHMRLKYISRMYIAL